MRRTVLALWFLASGAAFAQTTYTLTHPLETANYSVRAGPAAAVVVGDANSDGTVSVGDIFYLINQLFAGGPAAPASADSNGDGQVSVGDVFYLINHLFAAGPAPSVTATIEQDTDRWGNDTSSLVVTSVEGCRQACLGDATCRAYTYDNDPGRSTYQHCYLKNPAPPPSPKTNDISGIKLP